MNTGDYSRPPSRGAVHSINVMEHRASVKSPESRTTYGLSVADRVTMSTARKIGDCCRVDIGDLSGVQ